MMIYYEDERCKNEKPKKCTHEYNCGHSEIMKSLRFFSPSMENNFRLFCRKQ